MEAKSIEASNQLTKYLLAIKETVKTSEPGTLNFRIYQFEDKLMLVEEYEDEKALQAHLTSEAFKVFMEAVPSLTTGAPDLSYYREVL
ncbi:hypothetical protein M407DRAFT_28107 [Tulasnella calospora MUT 4182]|uniref:ABM domain-containing protein n=1 Tax=Tulasnella calospora MUT 4182 TaxID=1051891 RepID=A0A0C3LM43_9AGAM|nr:hypothetical protein M407DRAFT_28515 [Tulasnella calospora MUT 4182]KIO22387.1 hypothetical protein M407DRAFT_28107 [Tulasnella calospora MUT 4182]